MCINRLKYIILLGLLSNLIQIITIKYGSLSSFFTQHLSAGGGLVAKLCLILEIQRTATC